ncbi:aromatic acid/H+ symport family MFS transporter [Nonomuraea sp. NN258]|uniref:MFS transporter n=1 Tax=Nonomuraea antri TaxID=2730852 RepID=UPI001569B0FF|nr:aromatic acid/H+ symport family MFS transporter [Nonomuraea antri]NRQ39389.1 aromatic acid/H+ symport family MFS transporter [Nonomuraea antri]
MHTTDRSSPARPRSGLAVVAICFFTLIFDGYDLIVYGSVVPTLLKYEPWHLTPPQAGAIGSYALAGMLIGALVAGGITDVVGRRKIIIVSVAWFSVAMALCAIAPTPELFGLFRLIGGVGLGGVVPTAIALTVEYAPRRRRNLYNALMFCGYPVGGCLAALAAMALVSEHGWRLMFWIGAAPIVLILPLAFRLLPESASYLLARGRRAEAAAVAARYGLDLDDVRDKPASPASANGTATATATPAGTGFGLLFRRGYLAATLLFGAASFCGLLLIYGLNTWLPQIMRAAGYPLGSSLQFLLMLNLGAIVGSIVMSVFADRVGAKVITVVAFLAAAVCIYVLTLDLGTGLLMLCVAVAGLGSVGTQILVNGCVATFYPAAGRGSALGWSLGVGRAGAIVGPLMGGWLLGSGLGFEWNFYGFVLPALLGALAIAVVPRVAAARKTTTQVTDAPVGELVGHR